ncbi:MAG: NifB/NifX family molybdenum-iron cluster-binding protein [Acidobacteria bacterium]|nr:NifB/NifX family molybdenum-iron cluster-binding protein [Acidobacteriota bacterium]
MKISISAQGPNPEALVDPRFGRAAQFLIYDTDTDSYEVLSNAESQDAFQGAGIKAAETISRHGARVLITGHCGPKAFSTLKAAGIEVVTGAEGLSVSQAVDKYRSGQFNAANSSDVRGHWQ